MLADILAVLKTSPSNNENSVLTPSVLKAELCRPPYSNNIIRQWCHISTDNNVVGASVGGASVGGASVGGASMGGAMGRLAIRKRVEDFNICHNMCGGKSEVEFFLCCKTINGKRSKY